MDPTVSTIIEAIRENRERFGDFCRSLTPEQLERMVPDNTWAVKDFAAHLATLDVPLTRWIEGAAEGKDRGIAEALNGAGGDVDAFNEAQVLTRRAWPLDQVLAEAAQNRVKLIAALERLSARQLDQPMQFPGDSKRAAASLPLKTFLTGWAQHDPIHVADMLKALPECADDPGIRTWLDNPFVFGYQRLMNAAPSPQP